MSVRVDQRDVLDRVADIVDAAEFEIVHCQLARCECGATLLTFLTWDANQPVCAGCLQPPTYNLLPAPSSAHTGECERDADLTGSTSNAAGNAARSLNLRWDPWSIGALLAVPAVWCLLILAAAAVSS